MSTISLILFVITGLFLVWQVVLVSLASSMIRSGSYSRVHISAWPLIFATTACIIGLLMR